MGCGESKHAVATESSITQSKPLKDDVNTNTNAAPETANGTENVPNGEKKDDSNAVIIDATHTTEETNDNVKEIVGENGELPTQVENVKDDENKNEGAVVAEGEELKEKNEENQEATTEKTSNGDVADEKNGSTEEAKQDESINQNNEETPKEENIPKAKETVAEESKEDSKAN